MTIDPKYFNEPRTIREAAHHFKVSKVTVAFWLKRREQNDLETGKNTVKVDVRREGQRGPWSKTYKLTK